MIKPLYDISVLTGPESINYPGDTEFRREEVSSIRRGSPFNLSKLVMSAHTGTHIDTPAHFIERAETIDQYPVNDFILPARVIEIEDKDCIKVQELSEHEMVEGEAVLFKTDNSASGRCRSGLFSERYVYLSGEAAEYCVQKRVRLVGIDYITIDLPGDDAFPVHHRLLGNNILILEGIDLEKVPPGRYILSCLPLRISGAEASPVRAVLL
jgi:arylformamidase